MCEEEVGREVVAGGRWEETERFTSGAKVGGERNTNKDQNDESKMKPFYSRSTSFRLMSIELTEKGEMR